MAVHIDDLGDVFDYMVDQGEITEEEAEEEEEGREEDETLDSDGRKIIRMGKGRRAVRNEDGTLTYIKIVV